MGRSRASLHTEEIMSAEIKLYLDPSTLTDETVPWYGDMPDVAMALPWSTDPENIDMQNTPVWGWRIFLGAEDDPNRAKVEEWKHVDELAGLTKLWAGVYNGTIYLHAGDEAPAAASESDDMTGAPVASNASMPEQWRNGEPVLPFTPLAMESRDDMLLNADGKWRRLIWEPIGLFDIAPSKKIHLDNGYNVERYTLWMVVEHPYVAFYTTKAVLISPWLADGAPARWPHTYYANLAKEGQSEIYETGSNDGGFTVGSYDQYSNGYRLAPLPWQIDGNGVLEDEDEFTPFDGVQEGQFYTLPPAWPCPRYLATAFDYRVSQALMDAYQGNGAHYDYRPITKDQAKQAIVETIRAAATRSYSIDPALFEELGRTWPDGTQEGSCWQTDPPEYEVVFSLHLDETQARWPHWLAVMVCHAPTSLLIASACNWYNDFRPADGWENIDPNTPENNPPEADEDDPDDTPPSEDDPDGGGRPDDPDGDDDDDDETEEDADGVQELTPGYYYEAGNGVRVDREYEPGSSDGRIVPGWKHIVHLNEIPVSGFVTYEIALTVNTQNDAKKYDWPENNRTGLSMFYGVSADGAKINVSWRSSFQGPDRQPKEATAKASTTSDFSAIIEFYDLIVTSETAPNFGGEVLIATKQRSFVKRGTYKTWDKFRQRWIVTRYQRRFDVYRISVRGDVSTFAAAYVVANAPVIQGLFSPTTVSGQSDDLDGPTVTAKAATGTPYKTSTHNLSFGAFNATIIAEYESCQVSYSCSGQSSWNQGKKHGSISGSFTATLPQTSKQFEI